MFGHIGHGCVHTRIDWDFLTPEGLRNYRAFMEDAGDLIASYGGSLSGEHGDGHARAELLPKMFGGRARSTPSASSRRFGTPIGG